MKTPKHCGFMSMPNFSECEVVEAQMPFFLSITCLVVKMVLTVLIFGPEAVKPAEMKTDFLSRMKRAGKTGFQWSCLFLAIYTLISDVRRLLALTPLKWQNIDKDFEAILNVTNESTWQTAASSYFCVATVWTGSSNAATGFAMNALGVMFQEAMRFPEAHRKAPEEMRIAAPTNHVIREQKGFATYALKRLTQNLYFLPILFGSAPLLLLGGLIFFWIFVPAWDLGVHFSRLFHRIVMWLVKAGNRRDQAARSGTQRVEPSETDSDNSEQEPWCLFVPDIGADTDTESEDPETGTDSLIAEPVLPFEPVETPEAVRRVYESLYANPGAAASRGQLAVWTDEVVMARYQRDLETFRVLGTTASSVTQVAFFPFWSITIFLWAPLLVGRFATAMIWESQGFWAAYWDSAVVRTFGERHWWLYRDYLIKTCNAATWGGCESVYLGLLNRIWP